MIFKLLFSQNAKAISGAFYHTLSIYKICFLMIDRCLPDGLVGEIVLCEILCTSICHAIVDEFTENLSQQSTIF